MNNAGDLWWLPYTHILSFFGNVIFILFIIRWGLRKKRSEDRLEQIGRDVSDIRKHVDRVDHTVQNHIDLLNEHEKKLSDMRISAYRGWH